VFHVGLHRGDVELPQVAKDAPWGKEFRGEEDAAGAPHGKAGLG
jgi:hypothetical protein